MSRTHIDPVAVVDAALRDPVLVAEREADVARLAVAGAAVLFVQAVDRRPSNGPEIARRLDRLRVTSDAYLRVLREGHPWLA